jgi:phosphatidate cytidylyltransferase
MSYLEPPGGQTSSGDPYAAYRQQQAGAQAADGHVPSAPEDTGEAEPAPPAWVEASPATSTSQAEWELTVAEQEAQQPARSHGPGRRRAGRDGSPVKSKAGRNLPAAIAVGLSLGLVVIASLFVWPPAFFGVIVLATGIGVWELVRALRVSGAHPPLIPLLAGTLLIVGLAWYSGPDAMSLGLLVTVLAALVWRLADGPAGFQRDLTATALVAVYVPFLLSFGVLLVKPDDGPMRVICALACVVLSDTGGYAAGVFFGKRPMAPTISPKKSWEGGAGSVLAAAIGGSVLLYLLLDVPFYWGALFGAVISVASILGDLAESMLKRDLKIKDMSNLLPGHGGLMDRLDSIIFAIPAAYLLLSLIAPPK